MTDLAISQAGVAGADSTTDNLATPPSEVAYPFTSTRLSHANASHLHTTSRVVLIGPIPADWLRRHQKLWLARISRSSDVEFKQAWSSVFPDLPPPRPPISRATSIKIPASVVNEQRGYGNSSSSGLISSSLRGSVGALKMDRSVNNEGSPSRRPLLDSNGSPAGSSSRAGSRKFFSIDAVDAAHSPSLAFGAVPSRSSSRYHDVRSQASSTKSSPMQSPTLVATDPVKISSSPFTRYSENPSFEMPRSLSRGRSAKRYGSSGNPASFGDFAPSSYTSTQSFLTARGTSISASTTTDRSRSRRRSSSETPSQSSDSDVYTQHRRSASQGSEASTIRPGREAVSVVDRSTASTRIASAVMPVATGDSLSTISSEEMQPPQPVFLNVTKNAAKSSLSTILQRDSEIRRLRSDSKRSRSYSSRRDSFASDRRLLEADHDDEEHGSHDGSDNDSIRQMDFNLIPGRLIPHDGEVYDVVVDGASVLGAIGPELAGGDSDSEPAYRLKKGQIVKVDRVLVSIKSANVRSLPSDFNEADTTILGVIERAREYLAVARYTGDTDVPFCLELYRSLVCVAFIEFCNYYNMLMSR